MLTTSFYSLLVGCIAAMFFYSLLYPASYVLAQDSTLEPGPSTNSPTQHPDPDNPPPAPPATVDEPELPPGTFVPPDDGGQVIVPPDDGGQVIVPPPVQENSWVLPLIAIIGVIGVVTGAIALHKHGKPRTNLRPKEIPPAATVEIRTKGGISQ